MAFTCISSSSIAAQLPELFSLVIFAAPDIQEELLFLPRVMSGKAAIHDKMLATDRCKGRLDKQRKMWRDIKDGR